MKVVLSGAKSSGKSTIGTELAKRLGMKFIDLDDVILELARKKSYDAPTCAEIYRLRGETYFRDLEREAILEIKNHQRCILSTGGSTLLDPISRRSLRERSIWIFLDASWKYLWERLSSKSIPAYLENCSSPASAFQKRVSMIRETVMPLCDLLTEVEERTPDEIVNNIVSQLHRNETALSKN